MKTVNIKQVLSELLVGKIVAEQEFVEPQYWGKKIVVVDITEFGDTLNITIESGRISVHETFQLDIYDDFIVE